MNKKTALMVVHQPRSSTGDVGIKLRKRGYTLDVRRPVIGEKLPENMDEHDLAVIYGGPPSANDDLDAQRWRRCGRRYREHRLGCAGQK